MARLKLQAVVDDSQGVGELLQRYQALRFEIVRGATGGTPKRNSPGEKRRGYFGKHDLELNPGGNLDGAWADLLAGEAAK